MEQKSNNPILIIGVVVVLVLGVLLGMNMKKTSVDTTDQTGAAARTSVVSDASRIVAPTTTTVKDLISSGKVKLLSLADSQSVFSTMKLTFALPPADGSNRLIYYGCPGFTGVMVWDTNGFTTAEIFGWATGLLQSNCMIYGYSN